MAFAAVAKMKGDTDRADGDDIYMIPNKDKQKPAEQVKNTVNSVVDHTINKKSIGKGGYGE